MTSVPSAETEKSASPLRSFHHALLERDGIAGHLALVGVERQCEQRSVANEQERAGRVHTPRVARHEALGNPGIDRPELDAVVAGVAAGDEEKPAPVWQKTRKEVFGLLSGRIELGDRTNLATAIRNSKQHLSDTGREDDETVLAPGPA